MKKGLLCILVSHFLFCFSLHAQRKIENLSDSYSRNSITILTLNHGDGYDNLIVNTIRKMSKPDKFDYNDIGIYGLNAGYSRQVNKDQFASRQSAVKQLLEKEEIGKKIISYVYNRQPNGQMDASLIEKRGLYNATSEDFQMAQAGKLGESALADNGYNLLHNSYVLVVDYTNVKEEKDDKGKITYVSSMESFLYRLRYDEETNDYLFQQTWIYEEDAPEVKEAKKQAYDQMKIVFDNRSRYSTGVSKGSVGELTVDGIEKSIFEFENREESMAVRMAVIARNPIRANIGKKEGLKNTDRYFAYQYKMDNNGNIRAVRSGVVRATKIADNRGTASAERAPSSEFFQTHGFKIEEGHVLVQKNDVGMGVSAGYHFGGQTGLDVRVDYLASINTKGISHYVLLDFNADFYSPQSKWEDKGYRGNLNDIPTSLTALNIGVGYGVGARVARQFELVPRFVLGLDYLSTSFDDMADDLDDDDSFIDKAAFTGKLGADLRISLAHNVQIYVGVDYSFFISKPEVYEANYDFINPDDFSYRKRTGLGIGGGLRVTF